MYKKSFTITLPAWVDSFLSKYSFPIESETERMNFVIDLSMENINQQTGGPFGAAVFETNTGNLVSIGVNRVIPNNCSIAHAEIVALGFAEKKLQHFSLSSDGIPPLELITSTEPCAMCIGAIPWSGIRKIVYGATDTDARSAGFDEGFKPNMWKSYFQQTGIKVVREVCRRKAAAVLKQYVTNKQPIYNGVL